jgi:NADH-ubiquinone oxidoreductase chain 5
MNFKKINFNTFWNIELRNKKTLEQNVSNTLDIYVYLPLLFLLFLSIVSGFLLSDIFLGIGSNFFSEIIFINPLQKQIFFEKHFEIFSLKYIPILISLFFFFGFDFFNFFLKNYKFF